MYSYDLSLDLPMGGANVLPLANGHKRGIADVHMKCHPSSRYLPKLTAVCAYKLRNLFIHRSMRLQSTKSFLSLCRSYQESAFLLGPAFSSQWGSGKLGMLQEGQSASLVCTSGPQLHYHDPTHEEG